jgi:hypothetical protein
VNTNVEGGVGIEMVGLAGSGAVRVRLVAHTKSTYSRRRKIVSTWKKSGSTALHVDGGGVVWL